MNASHQNPQVTSPSPDGRDTNQPSPLTRRMIQSEEIMAGEKEVWIQHGDSVYRLCETKSGKLILQK